MTVHSQPAEAGEEDGSKNPKSSNVKEHFCFQDASLSCAVSLLQPAWNSTEVHRTTYLGNKNMTHILPCYSGRNLTRKPTEINKLLPDLHRDNRD